MPQPIPVVREIYWAGLIPQFVAIVILAIATHFCFPALLVNQYVLVAAAIYLILCYSLRAIFVREHRRGINAYRAGRFADAITHFQASYEYFLVHRWLDTWRSFFFSVASRNSYKVISMGNMAYCHAQLGNREKSIELYEQVLREAPDHPVARATLNILKAAPASSG
jgi:tetratricopeptide (TPR) repeat protein